MTMTWDLTDIPTVDADDLGAAMRSLIQDGRGLALMRGLSDADLDTVQEVLQRRFHGQPQRALAAFIRFRQMVEVFGSRRLQDMLLRRGHGLIAPAMRVAAALRLNAHRGFNPQQFVLSVNAALTPNVVALAPRAAAVAENQPELLAA
jgi:hypothetical protein